MTKKIAVAFDNGVELRPRPVACVLRWCRATTPPATAAAASTPPSHRWSKSTRFPLADLRAGCVGRPREGGDRPLCTAATRHTARPVQMHSTLSWQSAQRSVGRAMRTLKPARRTRSCRRVVPGASRPRSELAHRPMSPITAESTSTTHPGTERAVDDLLMVTFSHLHHLDQRRATCGVIHNGHNCRTSLESFRAGDVRTIPAGGREANRAPE